MKLLALDDHHLDYEPVLQIARAVREQLDWELVRERTRESPYARAFFALAEELGVVEGVTARERDRGGARGRVRVVHSPSDDRAA